MILKLFVLNLEKERRERKIRGNEMRRKYRERSLPNTNEDIEESMYNIIFCDLKYIILMINNGFLRSSTFSERKHEIIFIG